MATLNIPHSFVAGTPALASEVNANFQAVVSWTQGQIGTDNLGVLSARSVALPSSPTLAILSLAQTSSNIALNISNSGTDSSISISQSGLLANGKAAILIDSLSTQTTSGAAEVLMTLATNSTIPALLIKHGATTTFSLTKTQFNILNNAAQITSGGALTLTGAITANGLVTTTAPVSDAIAVKIKGRSSDNSSIIQFKSNDDVTEYAKITAQSTKLITDIPTGSTYEFKINNVDKVIIDNDGIDGQYLTDTSIAKGKMVAIGQQIATPANFTLNNISGYVDVTGATVTITTTGRPVLVMIDIGMWQMTNTGSGWENNNGYLKLVRDSTDLKVYKNRIVATDSNSYSAGLLLIESPMSAVYFDAVAAGTYVYKLRASADYQANPGQLNLNDIRLIAYEL